MKNNFWKLKIVFRSLILSIFGIQCTLSFLKLIQSGNNLIHLTFIEAENNKEYRHPLYTVRHIVEIKSITMQIRFQICPVQDPMSNFSNPNTTLDDVLFHTPYYPTVLFVPMANSPTLSATRTSIWVKDWIYGNESGTAQKILMHCQTFEIPQSVTLGTFESKVGFLITERSSSLYNSVSAKPALDQEGAHCVFLRRCTNHKRVQNLHSQPPRLHQHVYAGQWTTKHDNSWLRQQI